MLGVPTVRRRDVHEVDAGAAAHARRVVVGLGVGEVGVEAAEDLPVDVGRRGDLFATVKVKLPSKFSEEELDLFKKLRAKRKGAPEPPEAPAAEDSGEQDAGADEE